QPVEKAMGLRRGEQIKKIGGLIRVVSVRSEPLNAITQEDVVKEGFPDWTPQQFIQMLVDHYKVDLTKPVNRIEFKYL
ncbi:MAG: ASCH domain-containing protein, partial [Gammaproteobacteria bacterium]|nr:ASCH domain-containing protein [Gammaproteobacteria bacterium]